MIPTPRRFVLRFWMKDVKAFSCLGVTVVAVAVAPGWCPRAESQTAPTLTAVSTPSTNTAMDSFRKPSAAELKKKLTVKAHGFSGSAREKITQAGGTCEELPLSGIHHQDKPMKKSTEVKEAKK